MQLSSKKTLLLILIIIIVIAVPLTISQLKKQQEIRSRATGTTPVSFKLSPEALSKTIGENFDVQLSIDAQTNDISAIDITINFNKDLLELISFRPTTVFNTQVMNNPNNQAGLFRYVALNTTSSQITGSSINLGTISFKTKTAGAGTVNFQNTQVTGSGQSAILLTNNNSTGIYTIGDLIPTPTEIPTSIPLPTSTPVPTETPVPTNTPAPTITPEPTATIVPTPTADPNGTYLAFTLNLKGVGGIGENTNPKHPQKQLQVEATDTNGQVFTGTGTITFDSQTNNFKGNINMGDNFPEGAYTVKIKTDKYLKKLIPGIQNITIKTTNNMPGTTLNVGDSNSDNKLDASDYNIFLSCFGQKADLPSCMGKDTVDYDDNGIIDGVDFNIFLRSLATQEGD